LFRTFWFALLAVVLTAGMFAPVSLMAWGGQGHLVLTPLATERLPGALGQFARANKDFVVCYSILPDSWWGSPDLVGQLPEELANPSGQNGPPESDRHHLHLDLDIFADSREPRSSKPGEPFTQAQSLALFQAYVKQHGQQALAEFQRRNRWYNGGMAGLAQAMFEDAGSLPWVVEERVNDLTAAMKAGDWRRSLFLMSVIAHYVGDCHVPLHVSENYNGQLHPNPQVKGIHARWESGLLGQFTQEFKSYLAKTAQSTPLPADTGAATDVPRFVFGIMANAMNMVDDLVRQDDEILKGMGKPDKRKPQEDWAGAFGNGGPYNSDYYRKLFKVQGANAMKQLFDSSEHVALLWRVAWERAGSPQPPAGAIETCPLLVVDFKNKRIVPYKPGSDRPF
jgi:hypothetical protein